MAENIRPDFQAILRDRRIFFDPPHSFKERPSKRGDHFDSIRQYCNYTFERYSESTDIHSINEPWKQATKSRAKFIANRAYHLSKQNRNEEDWRMNLENDVLHRFNVEIAW
jgi:hypothetical protein